MIDTLSESLLMGMENQKTARERIRRACRFIACHMISQLRPSQSSTSVGLESKDVHHTSPDVSLDHLELGPSPTLNEEEWLERIDDKIRRAKDIIMENEMNMKVHYLKRRMEAIHGTNTDSTE